MYHVFLEEKKLPHKLCQSLARVSALGIIEEASHDVFLKSIQSDSFP